MDNKYFACLYLAMIGDKIGFNNGERETNWHLNKLPNDNKLKNSINGLTKRIIYEFIGNGGVSGIDTTKLIASDDTLMHLITIDAFNFPFKTNDELYDKITELYLIGFKDINYVRDKLLAGRQTIEAIQKIKSGASWRNFTYNSKAGGSGGPMRTMGLGLIYYKKNNLLQLIETTIMITSITHPNCTAFIGSLASALFTSYALHGIHVEKWIFEFKTLLESDTIDNVIEKIKPDYIENFIEDKKSYLFKINTYIEENFNEFNYDYAYNNTKIIYHEKRMEEYFEKYTQDKKSFYPGAGADDCIIIAYDSLLIAKNNYEHLIYTSMLMLGDSDTIGSIASAWYGAYYGFENVAKNLINELDEYYDTFKTLSFDIYNKYHNK